MSLGDVKQRYYSVWNEHEEKGDQGIQGIPIPPKDPESPTTRTQQQPSTDKKPRKKRKNVVLRTFGDEQRDYLRKETLKEHIHDPLKGIQAIIKDIYFNPDHEENHTIRLHETEPDLVEVHVGSNWIRTLKTRAYDKMIYRAADILENSTVKINRTEEFQNFIVSMGEWENDELLHLIREEVDDTVCTSENELKALRLLENSPSPPT